MSWSFQVPATEGSGFTAAAEQAVEGFKEVLAQSDDQPTEEAMASIRAAIAAGQQIIDSGVVGTGSVVATLSGHANPGHEPRAGWSNDCVTVYVGCADQAAAEAAQIDAAGQHRA